jgi:hypothetical protein
MTSRKTLDQMTSNDLDQLHARLDEYRASRRRWMEAAYQDRAAANDAHAVIARVRALHYQDGAYCATCTEDFGRLNADWPCPTIRALDEPAPLTDHEGRPVCTCTHDTPCGCGTSPHYAPTETP